MPLAIDLFCGLGGWTDGLLAEGWDVIGFDCERHEYGDAKYPAELVLQDVLTLHGSKFLDADLIVASPPCQEFSYMAMPWSRAKAKIGVIEACPTEWLRLCALFDACFRIQREAIAASSRHIPLIVENVRGAQRWVGRSRWNFGSFHLWGDVPALMPMTVKAQKFNPDGTAHPPGSWFAIADSKNRGAIKNTGGSWFNVAHNTTSGKGRNPDGRARRCDCGHSENDHDGGAGAPCNLCSCINPAWKTSGHVNQRDGHSHTRHLTNPGEHVEGRKQEGSGPIWFDTGIATHSSKSNARKAASAMIAKIPLPLSRYIGRTFRPQALPR